MAHLNPALVARSAKLHQQASNFLEYSAQTDDLITMYGAQLQRSTSSQYIGLQAQIYSVLISNAKPKEQIDALKEIIRTPLQYNDSTNQHVLTLKAQHPLLSQQFPNLSYMWMLKCVSFDAVLALAAFDSAGIVADMLLQSRIENGGWDRFGAEYVFKAYDVKLVMAGVLPRVIANIDPKADIRDACGWFNGPYASGYSAAQQAANRGVVNVTTATATPAPAAAVIATTSNNANQGDTTMTTIANINPAVKPLVDGMLAQAGIGLTIDAIMKELAEKVTISKELSDAKAEHQREITDLQSRLSAQVAMPSSITITNTVQNGLPNGTMQMVQAETLFPLLKGINMQVPHFTWDAPHPDVPTANNDYVFRKGMLLRALRSLTQSENFWLVGHTGSGKTTLVEEVAARLGWPVARIAFDNNVDRSELVGRMNLHGDGQGGTVSEWLPGIIEHAMTHGYIMLCDEMDAGHPNSLYTIQPILEGKPLTLLEDGGRKVHRHPMFRIAATGNTTGNGDPSGLYPACRILSAATLDRFVTFITVPYMSLDEECKLIKSHVPALSAAIIKKLGKFAVEMRTAFTSGQTAVSYSPRRSVAFAKEIAGLHAMGFTDEKTAVSTAFRSKLYDASPDEYRQRITEIANAAFGGVDPTIEL